MPNKIKVTKKKKNVLKCSTKAETEVPVLISLGRVVTKSGRLTSKTLLPSYCNLIPWENKVQCIQGSHGAGKE